MRHLKVKRRGPSTEDCVIFGSFDHFDLQKDGLFFFSCLQKEKVSFDKRTLHEINGKVCMT